MARSKESFSSLSIKKSSRLALFLDRIYRRLVRGLAILLRDVNRKKRDKVLKSSSVSAGSCEFCVCEVILERPWSLPQSLSSSLWLADSSARFSDSNARFRLNRLMLLNENQISGVLSNRSQLEEPDSQKCNNVFQWRKAKPLTVGFQLKHSHSNFTTQFWAITWHEDIRWASDEHYSDDLLIEGMYIGPILSVIRFRISNSSISSFYRICIAWNCSKKNLANVAWLFIFLPMISIWSLYRISLLDLCDPWLLDWQLSNSYISDISCRMNFGKECQNSVYSSNPTVW